MLNVRTLVVASVLMGGLLTLRHRSILASIAILVAAALLLQQCPSLDPPAPASLDGGGRTPPAVEPGSVERAEAAPPPASRVDVPRATRDALLSVRVVAEGSAQPIVDASISLRWTPAASAEAAAAARTDASGVGQLSSRSGSVRWRRCALRRPAA